MVTEFNNPVRDYLQEVEDRMRSRFNGNTAGLASMLEQFFQLKGMRLRPTLTILVGQMLDAEQDHLLDLAAAIELLHTATLIHDEMNEDVPARRPSQTSNAAWPPLANVLAGDLVFAIAATLAADTQSVRVMELFAETLATIVNREITNLFENQEGFDQKIYYRWMYGQTASMYELAAGAAAHLGLSENPKVINAAIKFGHDVGVAHQIVEDILDFNSIPADRGVRVGSNLRQGLITLPTLHYFEAHPHDPDLLSVIDHNGHDEETLNRLIAAIKASDAIDRSMDEAERLVKSSLVILKTFPDNQPRQALEELCKNIPLRFQETQANPLC